MIVNTNFLYDENKDNLYILIYKLGKGSYAEVWFSLEFEKFLYYSRIKKSYNIKAKALKIHMDDSYKEGMLETTISETLLLNKVKSEYINYPQGYFIYEETNVIVIYDLALGSLYDIAKKLDRKLPIDFVEKIIPQMESAIKHVHDCGYIHTDIKPENFLLMGINKRDKEILTWVTKYNLVDKMKRISNMKKNPIDEILSVANEPLLKFLNELNKKFGFKNNILEELDSDYDSDYDTNSDANSDENTNSDSNTESDSEIYSDSDEDNPDIYDSCSTGSYNSKCYDTDCSSYDSEEGDYDYVPDIFHMNIIEKILKENKHDNIDIESKINKTNKINITNKKEETNKELMVDLKNPIIKLTDFGLMEKQGSKNHTIQTRYYRCPEIIFGLDYDKSCDVWSLGSSIYEITIGKIMIDVEKDKDSERLDRDLINLKLLLEKFGSYHEDIIFGLINKSPRKDKLINLDGTIKFYTQIDYSYWENDFKLLIDENINEEKLREKIYKIIEKIDKMLKINKSNRIL